MEENNKSLDEQIEELEEEIRKGQNGGQKLKFVTYYVDTFHGTHSAIKAGYSAKTAHASASRVLKDVKIKALIRLYQRQSVENMYVNKEKILSEYCKMAFSNMADFLESVPVEAEVTGDNTAEIRWADLTKLPRSVMASVKGIKISEFKGGKGGRAAEKKVEITFHDKPTALRAIGEHLEFFGKPEKDNDRVQIIIGGDMGNMLSDDVTLVGDNDTEDEE